MANLERTQAGFTSAANTDLTAGSPCQRMPTVLRTHEDAQHSRHAQWSYQLTGRLLKLSVRDCGGINNLHTVRTGLLLLD